MTDFDSYTNLRAIEMLVYSYIYQTTRRHIPEDGNLHSHHCESLKSHILGYDF
jgi:hypothetical protein